MEKYDVVIIGGSYAGLSAALALGRSRRNVLIVDGGDPCNKPTPHSHNFLTQDGTPPSEIARIAKEQVSQYPTIQWHQGNVYDIMGEKEAFEVAMDGSVVLGKRVIIATGLKDVLLDIPGLKDCWGKTIIHCPYCHGYEFKDEETGILVPADQAWEMVRLISNWTDKLKLFVLGDKGLAEEELDRMLDIGVQVFSQSLQQVSHHDGIMEYLIMEDGTEESMKALYARLPFEQKASFLQSIGCVLTESGHIEVDMFGNTSVAGIYAVGDCAHPMRSVATAVYTGNIAGAMLNKEMIEDRF